MPRLRAVCLSTNALQVGSIQIDHPVVNDNVDESLCIIRPQRPVPEPGREMYAHDIMNEGADCRKGRFANSAGRRSIVGRSLRQGMQAGHLSMGRAGSAYTLLHVALQHLLWLSDFSGTASGQRD